MTIPLFLISAALGRVLFPTLSRRRDAEGAVAATWLRATKLTIGLAMPVALLFATAAPALITTLYGRRWNGAAVILELLSAAAVAQLFAASTGPVYQALGKTDALFRLGLAMSTSTVLGVVGGLPWGAVGVASGVLIVSWLVSWVPVRGTCRLLDLSFWYVMSEMRGLALAGAAFTCASLGARAALTGTLGPPALLAIQALAGSAFMLSALTITDRELLAAVRVAASNLRKRRPRNRSITPT
jgi:PST family polysaccharide transporter